MEQLRDSLRSVLGDCKDERAQRVGFKINRAQTPEDLWILRSELLMCVSQAHSQGIAIERINQLVKAFKGWLPASQLTRI